MLDRRSFLLESTIPTRTPLVPEIVLYLATELNPLWHRTERELEAAGVPPPYWAFAWAGGQALARHLLDEPSIVRGRAVLDLGAGSGLVAIAAALAGARHVLAADIDPFAAEAIALNSEVNGVVIEITTADLLGTDPAVDVILVGDLCYERPVADRLVPWLTARASRGTQVLLGDPGRSYLPPGLRRAAVYNVPTTQEIEDQPVRETAVYALDPGPLSRS
ncbi:MAG: 50S ribosomal protein L11 methyltransferase [Byssovorax sp.]